MIYVNEDLPQNSLTLTFKMFVVVQTNPFVGVLGYATPFLGVSTKTKI
jgi:hypothetical protein